MGEFLARRNPFAEEEKLRENKDREYDEGNLGELARTVHNYTGSRFSDDIAGETYNWLEEKIEENGSITNEDIIYVHKQLKITSDLRTKQALLREETEEFDVHEILEEENYHIHDVETSF